MHNITLREKGEGGKAVEDGFEGEGIGRVGDAEEGEFERKEDKDEEEDESEKRIEG